MPQTLYALYLYAAGTLTTSAIVAAVIEIAVIAASAIYANQQRQKLKGLARGGLDQGRQVMSRDGTAPRVLIYGTQRISGPIAFMQLSGTDNEYLHVIVLLASHELEEITTVYFDDYPLNLDGSGNDTGRYSGFTRVKLHLGTDTQASDTDLTTDCPIWTTLHQLKGIAYVYARLKYSNDVYPNGIPNISAVVKGRKIYDPRDGTQSATNSATWKWSTNSALCLADYLNHPRLGMNIAFADIDQTELISAANTCDENVTLVDTSTEKRYTTNTLLDTSSTPEDNINLMRWAMIGQVVYSGGAWYIQAGAYRTPTLTFDESHIVAPINVSPRLSRKDLCNAVKGLRLAPESDWVPVDFKPYIGYVHYTISGVNIGTDTITATAHGRSNGDIVSISSTGDYPAPIVEGNSYYIISATTNTFQLSATLGGSAINITYAGTGAMTLLFDPYLNADNGERIWLDLELAGTKSNATAQRIAKANLEINRQQITVTATMNLSALKFRAGETIMLSIARMGWSSKVFEVTDWRLNVAGSGAAPAPVVEVTLRETASGVWDWNGGQESAYDLAADTTLPSAFNPAPPTSLALQSGSPTVIIQPDGTIVPRLKASWTAPADQSVKAGGKIKIEYKRNLDSNWINWSVLDGSQTFDYITDVKVGDAYDVRVRAENTFGVNSTYATVTNHTVAGDSTAPSVPTSLTAAAGTGKMVALHWTGSPEADVFEYGIYRNTSNTFGTATKIAETSSTSYNDATASVSTNYWYWVTGIDGSENESGPSTVAAVTTGSAPGANTTPPSSPTAPVFVSSSLYQASDGNFFASLKFTIAAMPTGAAWQNVLFIGGTSVSWNIASQLSNTGSTVIQIDDLTPGRSYLIGVEAFNSDGVSSGVVQAAGNPYATPSDSSAPASPTGLTIKTGPGLVIELDWNDNTESDFSEYGIWQNTVNTFGSATMIAQARASKFLTSNLTAGTQVYFWITAYDWTENVSAPSSSVNATPQKVIDGQVDQTAPSNPTAATLSSSGIYNSHDGTVFSYLDISVPAVPSGAKYQNILYKKTSGSYWLIASQIDNTGTQVVRLDDLSPNSIYDVATQAYSFSGVPSSIVAATSSPFTAPTKSAGPSAPQTPTIIGPTTSGSTIPPVVISGVLLYAAQGKWQPPADNDVDHYEVKSTVTNSSGATDYSWSTLATTKETFLSLYNFSLQPGHTFVRAINRSGIAGAWAYCGNAFSVCSLPIGTLSVQDASDAKMTGMKIGGSPAIQQTVQNPYNNTVVLTGGASAETHLITLPSGFSYKPDTGVVTVTSANGIHAHYDWDDLGNSSTKAAIVFVATSGTLPSGAVRIQAIFGTNN